jgi:predicted hydrocarbon binding protein
LVIYENNREDQSATGSKQFVAIIPQPYKTMLRMINVLRKVGVFPSDFGRVSDMKRVWWWGFPYKVGAKLERYGRIDYLPEKSRPGEHHYRIYENSDCWDFDGVGATTASYLPPAMAGHLMGMESRDRLWNAVETKCIGMGDPYCEIKLVPGEIDERAVSLQKDADTVAHIHTRLIDKFVSFILESKPLTDRPQLGPLIHLQLPFHTFGFPYIAGDRSRMAIRMGGAKSGKEIAERLLGAGLEPDEVVQRVLSSIEGLRVGVVTAGGGRIQIEENIEPVRTKYMIRLRDLSCYFTTGFLNGLYGAALGLRLKETRCVAAGDPYCEWEIV